MAYKNAMYRAARALEAPEQSGTLMCTHGCDTIYRVLEGVTETLRKAQWWAVHQSSKKVTGAQDRPVERGIVKRSFTRKSRT